MDTVGLFRRVTSGDILHNAVTCAPRPVPARLVSVPLSVPARPDRLPDPAQ